MIIGKDGGIATINLNGEIESFKINGEELVWNGDPEFWAGHAPTLFPNCGRVKNNRFTFGGKELAGQGIHGFVRRMEHSLVEASELHAVYRVTSTAETKKLYPYDFTLETLYAVSDVGYAVRFTVYNDGVTPMPFCIGSHPAYMLPGGLSECDLVIEGADGVEYCACNSSGLIEDGLTLGIVENGVLPLSFDLFEKNGVVFPSLGYGDKAFSVINRNTGKGFKVIFKDFPACVLWTPKADCPFFCVEPWCGLPDREDTDGSFEGKAHVKTLYMDEAMTFEYAFVAIKGNNA